MSPFEALLYSFFFGLLHGVLPDEHTWPITLSYAIGGASGKEGMKAGFFFSAAFAVQRAVASELAYLALAPLVLTATINGIVYIIVGVIMSVAGAIVLRKNRYPHFHLLGHHHEEAGDIEQCGHVFGRHHTPGRASTLASGSVVAPPVHWTLIHGFVAGFGFGGFSLFVNTVASPAMRTPWLGFLPGLLFGLGTMIMLTIIGALFGGVLHLTHSFTEREIKRIGAQTGGRTLFFGGGLFAIFGVATLLGFDRYLPVDGSYVLVGSFMAGVAGPAFLYSLREVQTMKG
ncbi:MAG: hypothetical protein ACPL4I_01955 [Bacteroidota bacterium]